MILRVGLSCFRDLEKVYYKSFWSKELVRIIVWVVSISDPMAYEGGEGMTVNTKEIGSPKLSVWVLDVFLMGNWSKNIFAAIVYFI